MYVITLFIIFKRDDMTQVSIDSTTINTIASFAILNKININDQTL